MMPILAPGDAPLPSVPELGGLLGPDFVGLDCLLCPHKQSAAPTVGLRVQAEALAARAR